MINWPRRKRKEHSATRTVVPPAIWVSNRMLELTASVLRQSRFEGQAHEGVVYWAGRRTGHQYFITTCIAPNASTTVGSFDTTAATNAKVVMYLANVELQLLGQVHSHPGYSVGHSAGDDKGALMPYDGFLSIVVPYYGKNGMSPLTTCGVHIYENSRFQRMSNVEVQACFQITEELADLRFI